MFQKSPLKITFRIGKEKHEVTTPLLSAEWQKKVDDTENDISKKELMEMVNALVETWGVRGVYGRFLSVMKTAVKNAIIPQARVLDDTEQPSTKTLQKISDEYVPGDSRTLPYEVRKKRWVEKCVRDYIAVGLLSQEDYDAANEEWKNQFSERCMKLKGAPKPDTEGASEGASEK